MQLYVLLLNEKLYMEKNYLKKNIVLLSTAWVAVFLGSVFELPLGK
jgi:hypothetical protein